jgi:hypothetical protein
MLGDISFKLETKIMNFMSVFFRKKYNQVNLSVVNNMQYNLFTIKDTKLCLRVEKWSRSV